MLTTLKLTLSNLSISAKINSCYQTLVIHALDRSTTSFSRTSKIVKIDMRSYFTICKQTLIAMENKERGGISIFNLFVAEHAKYKCD